ncbi:MAG: hypothetical protein HWN66_21640, partial [Candidatus Helarchaeota archaeon]|nr:hypothetical protein [Candidatus Helarchaeota archaeon]
MSLMKKCKRYLLIMLIISAFLMMANQLTIKQGNPGREPIIEGRAAILSSDENVTYVT